VYHLVAVKPHNHTNATTTLFPVGGMAGSIQLMAME
jgi:hypothetical protein